MPNIVVIIQDDRVRRSVELYLQELDNADLRIASFKTQKEFAQFYFREPSTETSEPSELKLFGEVHLVIFALDTIGGKSGPWIENVKTNFKKYKHWPKGSNPLRMIMLKYEDDGIGKLEVLHPLLDDLIYLPLDRLVFLQKLQIIIALPQRARPEFLFNQEVKQNIEISKISKMDRLSDVGLAIRNPISLRRGLPGHFYIQLPGEKTRLEIRAKVFRSEPHPEYPGQYLVYFTYFGLAKADLTRIRQALAKSNRYQSLLNDDRAAFHQKQDDMFGTASDSESFGIAVVDSDDIIAANLATQIGKDMDLMRPVHESSYQMFLSKYFEKSSSSEKALPRTTVDADFYRPTLTLTVNVQDLKCMTVDPSPNMGDLILGHVATDLFAHPEKWLALIVERNSRLLLQESAVIAARGKAVSILLVMQDAENQRRGVSCKLQRGVASHLVNLTLSAASLSAVVARMSAEKTNAEIGALILDTAFVPEDPLAWIEGLRTRAIEVGLTKKDNPLKFFLIADDAGHLVKHYIDMPDILGLFIKPVDNRQLMFLLSEYLPNKNTVYQFENLGWANPSVFIHVSKSVELEALSEFGSTLKASQQLAPGTMIYLRKSIYDNAPNQCLAARVYACEEHPTEKGFYQVYTTYFGINDQFLKFARTWIREHYASKKGRES